MLEREIRPEEVRVDVVTDEERWALRYDSNSYTFTFVDSPKPLLRLVNMMFCLDDLLTGQRCVSRCPYKHLSVYDPQISLRQREMPVFGLVHDQVITGIIVRNRFGIGYAHQQIKEHGRMRSIGMGCSSITSPHRRL